MTTKKLIFNGVFMLTLVGISSTTWSSEVCPAEITTTQEILNAPSGYEPANDDYGPHRLQSIRVYDGLVKDMASLIPDVQKKNLQRWNFDKKSRSQPREVACHYSRTRVILTKSLPTGTSSCTVIYNPIVYIEGNNEIKSFTCKSTQ
ncbi:hypothetical protein GCM10009007_00550 [Formosimonas limnophila]|uniref:Uncharacterized protein n=1 Tax=Formosimonas limnophila TaxID=1384487 RepID=A0A8J3CFA8_9BURK|nr:STY0301 family protein [Formosimonas limnophila]GHA64113.1 hypothetical protein GCM10009007_00550 [Formosimonas limnophila]